MTVPAKPPLNVEPTLMGVACHHILEKNNFLFPANIYFGTQLLFRLGYTEVQLDYVSGGDVP